MGVPYQYREVDIFQPLSGRPREFREQSRFGEVPVLVHDGITISQSNAILLYLSELTGRYGGEPGATKPVVLEWLFWEMSRLNLGVANLRFLRCFERSPPADVVSLFEQRARESLAVLDTHLGATRFVAGREVTIADISCCGYLFWSHQAGLDLAKVPNVSRWLNDVRRLKQWRPPEDLLR